MSARMQPCRSGTVRALLLGVCLSAGGLHSASAKDVELLVRVLAPAYIATHFAAVCVTRDEGFVRDTIGPRGDVYIYARHVKEEVTADIHPEIQGTVVQMAQGAAIGVVKHELNALPGGSPAAGAEGLTRWCERSAKPFVREVMTIHFAEHDNVEAILLRAKRKSTE